MKLIFFETEARRQPAYEFIQKLNAEDRAKVLGALKTVEERGYESPRVQFRQIKGRLWEIKIRTSKARYRVFYVVINQEKMILLHAYKKQSQKAPKKEIKVAEERMKEVLRNEKK